MASSSAGIMLLSSYFTFIHQIRTIDDFDPFFLHKNFFLNGKQRKGFFFSGWLNFDYKYGC